MPDNDSNEAKVTSHDTEPPESPKLKRVHTKASEKHDEPTPEPPEADEFGLPVRPPRRRNYTLDSLDGPDEIRKQVVEDTGGEVKTVGAVGAVKAASVNGEEGAEAKKEGAQAADGVAQNGNEDAVTPRESLDAVAPLETVKTNASSPQQQPGSPNASRNTHAKTASVSTVSEFSHQAIAAPRESSSEKREDELEWQEMPALATHRIYDDWGKVLAKEYDEVDDEKVTYSTLGGAGRGYTRVQMDEDAKSATSLDDNTAYLFKDNYARNMLDDDDEDGRDVLSQMQATKELLTEGQRIAYVGIVRLSLAAMQQFLDSVERNKNTKKVLEVACEAMKMWSQKIMLRLYTHMEVDSREQIMVEQLASHGVLPSDLTPALMANARVKNPNPDAGAKSEASSSRPSVSSPRPSSAADTRLSSAPTSAPSSKPSTPAPRDTDSPPPVYEKHTANDLTIENPDDYQNAKNLDIDIRWTVLCDLFLILIADSTYDARGRTLLEKVGDALSVPWQEICRFEKRITDALEMQEQVEKENWNEDEHLENRRKQALKKRMMVMGLCTVGGGLVIGLSAGLLAPVIGAGLAAGFTAVGVTGTGTFLGGTGAAALIGTTGTLIGGRIGQKTSNRRTAAVKTYEYKPLFNNKRVNLIVTVAGWMTGKVDDVRLPFSTIDPIMGDIYSVNWEPEMLQSTGQTIQILGTEALTQTIQQILGMTVLTTLMAGLQAPLILAKISYLIDNPWTTACARGDSVGLILADSIIDRNLGVRPITLVGFSLGSRVIFSCLKELARRGGLGLVQNVYIFGAPVVVKKDEWIKARSVVSGRFVNGYATNDWILGYLFRATQGGIMRVAGLANVDIPGIENVNVTEDVPGHMAYRGMMPTLLDKVGWAVESLEYTEIEDPDPENHKQRQRELIDEIEEARRQLDEQPEKKGIKGWFSKKKTPQKKSWETYDERSQKVLEGDENESSKHAEETSNVMFDVDAIRREALNLALQQPGDIEEIKKHLSVREIESTMPALKVTLPNGGGVRGSAEYTPDSASRPDIRHAQSHDGTMQAKGSSSPDGVQSPTSPNDGSRLGTASFGTSSSDRPHSSYHIRETTTEVGSATASAGSSRYATPDPEKQQFDQASSSSPAWDQARPLPQFGAAGSHPPPLRSVSTPVHSSTGRGESWQGSSGGGGVGSPVVATNPNHNPWSADADDPDFGKETEVMMSF